MSTKKQFIQYINSRLAKDDLSDDEREELLRFKIELEKKKTYGELKLFIIESLKLLKDIFLDS